MKIFLHNNLLVTEMSWQEYQNKKLNNVNVKIKKINPEAVIPFKTYKSDFCYDVTATSEKEVAPNVWKYGIGLAFQIERDDSYQDLHIALDFRPRSSVWKTGMTLSNCVGTIDELYIGEVSAVFYHIMTDMPRYKVGDRIGQIKIGLTEGLQFVEVTELGDTERGNGGYGSTGQ